MSRNPDSLVIGKLNIVIRRAERLQEKRDELQRALSVASATVGGAQRRSLETSKQRVWVPTSKDIADCLDDAKDLQNALGSIAREFVRDTGRLSPESGDNSVYNFPA